MVPGLLVIMELSGRLATESKILGVISLVPGILLGFFLFIHLISFRNEDLGFMRDFVIVFLVFLILISIGQVVSDNTLGVGQVLKRYKDNLKTYSRMIEEGTGKAGQSTTRLKAQTSTDSTIEIMADQICVEEFFRYASEQYYQDLDSWFLYLGVNEIMSVYQVLLVEFEVKEDESVAVDPHEMETIIENRAGSHTQLTLLFAACLKNFDQRVEVIETTNGNLVTMVRINPGYYPHLMNFIHNDNLSHVLTWYMQEQMVSSEGGFFHWVPLYIPVHKTYPPAPYGKLITF
jgi:hypothetical protein